MIRETIDALDNSKLHEVVIRISQMTFEQLTQLAISYLANDYTQMYSQKILNDELTYEFQLPDAYTIAFKIAEENGDYLITLEFFSDKPILQKIDGESKYIISRFYSIEILNIGNGWQQVGIHGDKEKILKLIQDI